MEPHPVPKNILTVEFKLFGSLTTRQFMRILLGALGALGLFAIGLPGIISLPLMVASVLLGLGSAMIEGFDAKLTNFIKALFVSPRYVWKKTEKTPEVLQRKQEKARNTAAIANARKTQTDVSIEQLLDARAAARAGEGEIQPAGGSNFGRVYAELFQPGVQSAGQGVAPQQTLIPLSSTMAGPAVVGQTIPIGPTTQAVVRQVTGPQPVAAATAGPSQTVASQEGVQSSPAQELRILQVQLDSLTRLGASPEQKQPYVDRINAIYSQLKQQAMSQVVPDEAPPLDKKRMLYGVIVDSADTPLSGTAVVLEDVSNNPAGQAVSGEDGRFAIESELPPGQYHVQLSLPGKQFPRYTLNIGAGTLPAYKFRAQ